MKNSCQLETAMSKSSNEVKDGYFFYSLLIAFFLFTAHCSLLTAHCFAQDTLKESLSDLNRIIPSKKVVNTSWGRDPFVPLTGDGLGKPGNLKLTAIIYNAKKPSAIVNNKIIYIGDNVDGQKVIDITKQYVILRGISGSYKLEIGNPAGQSYDIKKIR
ncbi:MAG: hypothetical protein HY265_04835 [Deltaproteobacteria bacterium]|nr:hypothetical protein [Deltaproteobacteria bacterium]